MLRAVTLDFWNTLFVDRRGRERERMRAECLLTELGALGICRRAAAADEALLAASQVYFERAWRDEHRTPACSELVDVILTSLDARVPEDVHARIVATFERALLAAAPDPVPNAPRVVRDLAARYRLAIISDTGYSPGHVLRELLARHDMLEPFSYLYFSNEGGASKPERCVFLQTLEALAVRPTEAAHVGDMECTDVQGAHAAGMWAVHFVGANNHDAAQSSADVVVWRFNELPAALGSLTRAGG